MSHKCIDSFVHPVSKAPLVSGTGGGLCLAEQPGSVLFENHDGSYDFADLRDGGEKEYYDREYSGHQAKVLSAEFLARQWLKEACFEVLWDSLGDVSNKRILFLGNGESVKELSLVERGAFCIYTDLSFQSVLYLREVFELSALYADYSGRAEFHAANACYLPFSDESFDLIYGCAFVHHIANLDSFFSEVSRCLVKGGFCRFIDDAYSPIWQFCKRSPLRPLQILSHKRTGISPADHAATKRGGYRAGEIEELRRLHGFREALYTRVSFLEYLLWRGTLKFGCRYLRRLLPIVRATDAFLARRTTLIEKNGIRLVWGFTK